MAVNQCDINCPLKTFEGLEYRLSAENAGTLGKLAAGIGAGIEGAAQAGYAAMRCPSRSLNAREWEPSERCMSAVTGRLEQADIDPAKMTPHEVAVLLPIIRTLLNGDPQAE